MPAPDPADVADLVDDEAQGYSERVIDAVTACACVDQRPDTLLGEVGLPVFPKGPAKPDIDNEGRPQVYEKVGWRLTILALLKAGLGQARVPA